MHLRDIGRENTSDQGKRSECMRSFWENGCNQQWTAWIKENAAKREKYTVRLFSFRLHG